MGSVAELLRKEQSHDLKRKRDGGGGAYKKSDLNKFREKGLAKQKEMEERLARDARQREEMAAQASSTCTRRGRRHLAACMTSMCANVLTTTGWRVYVRVEQAQGPSRSAP